MKGNQMNGKMAMGDKDEHIQRLTAEKERMAGIIESKNEVIEKKERLIQEYKSDIERERREKADIMKKTKEMQSAIDENKYLLQQKGDSQTETSRKLE